MIVTISNVNGIKQYNVPDNIKKIIIMILVLVVLVIVGLSFYIVTLHSKINALEQNNHAKTGLIHKQSSNPAKKQIRINQKREKEKLEKEQLIEREKQAKLKKEKALLKKREEAKQKREKIEKDKLAKKAREEKLVKQKKERLAREKQAKKEIERKERLAKALRDKKKHSREIKKLKLVLAKKGDESSGDSNIGTMEMKTFGCLGLSSYMQTKENRKTSTKFHLQSKCGKFVKKEYLKPGDLLFFDASKPEKGTIGEMGIYIGNNKFIRNNSSNKRSTITSLHEKTYRKRYMWARRVGN